MFRYRTEVMFARIWLALLEYLLVMSGLARRPTSKEVGIARQLLMARKGNEKEMMQDLWWAILNSNEFIMQH